MTGKRRPSAKPWIVGLSGAAVLVATSVLWYAALAAGDGEVGTALIGVAGSLTAALVGAACGVVSAAWGDRLQRAAERRTALLEVSTAVDTYNRERTDARRWRLAAKDPTSTNEARSDADQWAVTAVSTAFAARSQALSAVKKALDIAPDAVTLATLAEAIREARMSPDEEVDEVATHGLEAELARYR